MKKLHIWLEATHIYSRSSKNLTGIGHLTDRTITSLLEVDRKNSYVVFANLFVGTPRPRGYQGARARFVRFIPGKIWNQLIKKKLMPAMQTLFGAMPDVVVFFNYVSLPSVGRTKTILYVHDMTFEVYPQLVEQKNTRFLKDHVPASIKNVDRVVTISEATKRDILRIYKVPEQKVVVVPCAIDHELFRPQPLSGLVRKKYHLPNRYVLFVGTLEPRKNLITLINAHRQLSQELAEEYPIVFVGMRGWVEDINKEVEEYCASSRSVIADYVATGDLPEIYSGASVTVLPSTYEGFGIPLLESMACGTPVIGANNSSIPEVIGDAGLLFDTSNPDDLAKKMSLVLSDKKVAVSLSQKGVRRARHYSWRKSASLLLGTIEDIAKG